MPDQPVATSNHRAGTAVDFNWNDHAGFGLRAIKVTQWHVPGWHRRSTDGTLKQLDGWRLILHRILWGFGRLKYIDPKDAWVEIFNWPEFNHA